MRNTVKTEQPEAVKIGKVISPKLFKLECRGCKGKFNNFVRFCISPDSIKWDCDNCGNKFSMYCGEHETDEENTLKISVFQDRRGELTNKNFLLIDNYKFKEVLQ